MDIASRLRMGVLALLASVAYGACGGAPMADRDMFDDAEATSPQSAPAKAQAPPIELPKGAPTEASLRSVADAVARRDDCSDTCCLGVVPSFVMSPAAYDLQTRYTEELRAIIDRAGDAHARALALLWLAQAVDARDIDRMARHIDSAEPAGRFPTAAISQMAQMCYPIRWEPLTVGQVSLAAIEAVTGASLPDPAAFRAWRRDNPDPMRSLAYWERVLGRRRPSPPPLLARLSATDAELYAKVLLMAPGEDPYGAGEDEIVRAARAIICPGRLLRLLGQEEAWPEIASSDERLARLALTVLPRAEVIFDASNGPALLKLWERGALRKNAAARASLAVAVSRLQGKVADRCRILTAAVDELNRGDPRLLEEIARACAGPEEAVLRAWFYGPRAPKNGSDASEAAVAILKGLRPLGGAARPLLKALVKAEQPIAEDPAATEALIDTAIAAGCPDPFAERSGIRAPMSKNMYAGEDGDARRKAAEAKALAARRDCVARVLAWLSSS
jgi:hypothetical protein